MDTENYEFLPALIKSREASILDIGVSLIDDETFSKRLSAKEASDEAKKNEVRTSTQRRYESVHKLYKQFCFELKLPPIPENEKFAAELIHYFISCSIINKKLKPQTISVYLAAMANFFKKEYPINPTKLSILDNIKKSAQNITEHDEKSKKPLELWHAIEMIERCDLNSLRGLMHRAILAFAICSACRRSEIARLHTDQMTEDKENDGYAIRIKTKTTYKTKYIKSLKGVPLRRYIKEWKQAAMIEHGYLFHKIDRYGNLLKNGIKPHIHDQEIKNIIKHYAKGIDPEVNVDEIAGHSTRSGIATNLLKKGASLKSVQDLLGHKKPAMTLHYHKRVNGWKDHAADVLNDDKGDNND